MINLINFYINQAVNNFKEDVNKFESGLALMVL